MEKYLYRVICDDCSRQETIEFTFSCNSEGDGIESRCRSSVDAHIGDYWIPGTAERATGWRAKDLCPTCVAKHRQAEKENEEMAEYQRLQYLNYKYGPKRAVKV